MDFFFYGTLTDADVRQAVMGVAVAASPAIAYGYRRFTVRSRHYPIMLPWPRGTVAGCVCEGLTQDQVERLVAFEGPEYDLASIQVEQPGRGSRAAWCFVGNDPALATPVAWDLETWQRRTRAPFLRRLRMGRVG